MVKEISYSPIICQIYTSNVLFDAEFIGGDDVSMKKRFIQPEAGSSPKYGIVFFNQLSGKIRTLAEWH